MFMMHIHTNIIKTYDMRQTIFHTRLHRDCNINFDITCVSHKHMKEEIFKLRKYDQGPYTCSVWLLNA